MSSSTGLAGIPAFTDFAWVYGCVILTIVGVWRIADSAIGRSLTAIREDEVAADDHVAHRAMTQVEQEHLDAIVMVGVAVLFLLFFLDLRIALWEALVFLAGIVVYTLFNVKLARRQASQQVQQEFDEATPKPTGALWKDLLLILGGLAVLVLGSRLFVSGSVQLAKQLGMSDAVIGLTIIAAGTSLPELASSLMAAARKQPDIAIGNVVGSNIYNILAILGVSGVIRHPLDGQGVGLTDTWIMIGVSCLLLVIAWTGFKLKRWEGALLLALYGGYLWHLWPKS